MITHSALLVLKSRRTLDYWLATAAGAVLVLVATALALQVAALFVAP